MQIHPGDDRGTNLGSWLKLTVTLFMMALFVIMPRSAMAVDAVDQSQTSDLNLVTDGWTYIKVSEPITQSFKPSKTDTISRAKLYVKLVSGTGDLTVSIRTDDGTANNYPTSSVLGSVTISSTVVTSAYTWIEVIFPTPIPVTAETIYHLYAETTSGTEYRWQSNAGDKYARGRSLYYFLAENRWDDLGGIGADTKFEIYLGTLYSTNANLSGLSLSSGTLSPTFAAGTTSYTASVAYPVSSITVTPTVEDATATVKVNGTTVTSGQASGAIALNVGSNTITVLVTAEDGTTTKTYTVTVTRAAPSINANLSGLSLSSGTLSPSFAANTTSYAATVGYTVSSITVTPTVADSTATVKVNGSTVTSGQPSGAIALNVGSNTITAAVTAQDGTTTKTYTVTVTRLAPPDLTVAMSHSGNFQQGQTGATYTITASNGGADSTSGTVSVTVTLPSGLTATAITGTGWSCTFGTLTCTRSDALAAGGSHPAIALTVDVAANAAASLSPSATVSGGGETSTGNNSASDTTTVYAGDGSGTMAVSPDTVAAGQAGVSLSFTYTAPTNGMSGGAVELTVPAGWTAPSTTATAEGYTTASTGTVGVSGQVITVSGVTLSGGQTLTATYGSTAGGGSGAQAPSTLGAATFTTRQKSLSGSSLTALAASPSVTVANAAPMARDAGYLLTLNGSSQYVTVPSASELNPADKVTVEAWVYLNSYTPREFHGIIIKGAAGDYNYHFQLFGNAVRFTTVNGSGGTSEAQTTTTLSTGRWYHLAGVHDGTAGKIRIYINGILDAEAAASGSLRTNTGALTFGAWSDNGSIQRYLNGVIDEVRVWTAARTVAQIQASMNSALTGSETGLIGYWRLNEGAGSTAADTASATANTGTLMGSPTWTASSAATVAEGSSVTGRLSGADNSGAAVTYTKVTDPTNGTAAVTASTGAYTYTHNGGETTSDSFAFKVNDGTADSSTVTVNITVTAVNDTPSLAANNGLTVDEGATGAITAAKLQVTDVDNTAAQITYTVGTAPANGTLKKSGSDLGAGSTFTQAEIDGGLLTYVHNGGETTGDSFSFTVSDGAGGSIASTTFTITVTPVNDTPAVTPPSNQTIDEEGATSALAFTVADAETAAGSLTVTAASSDTALVPNSNIVLGGSGSSRTVTVTPAANANGTVTITLSASDGAATGTSTFTVTVSAVNDAPSFAAGSNETVLEDAGAQTVAGWATSISKGPANEAAQTLTFTVAAANSGLFAAQPAITADGTLTYTLAADANGTATVTVVLKDDGGGTNTAATQTFTITVTAVNDVPSFTAGANQTVLEDSGAHTVTGWASAISKGPADESSQSLTFTLTTDNPGLFAVAPAITADGTLTYTLVAEANGAATVSVVLSDDGGGTDTAATQTFTITVTAVNDVPSFTAGGNQTVLEDAGAQTVTGWASAISKGPADEAGQNLTFAVTSDNNSLFTTQPAITADGTLTYTLAADANGSATVSVVLKDNGGTAGGGVDTAATQTFTITVTAVNDVPSFTAGADQTVLEDAGAQTVAGWASAISKGPANEAAQSLTFTVTNDNSSLFATAPAITADGTLTYTLTANANGLATVSVVLSDGGDGTNTAATQTFTITVTAVNDVPGFTAGANQTLLEDAGAQTVGGWATNISKGPADESGQSLTFTLTNDNNSLFAVQPAITAGGTLTYTLAADANGSATVSVVLSDNGGTAGGGVDTAATQTFTITVTAVNDLPGFAVGSNQTVLEDAGTQTVTGWATSISKGPANEAGQSLTFTVTSDNTGIFAVQPAVTADGTLTYTLTANANGLATVSVVLSDNGDGTNTAATQTFTITVTAVNDVPSFTRGADQTVLEDSGAQTVVGWATNISKGPADEAGQALTFTVASDNPGLFATAPAITADGTLTYTLSADAYGTATVTVVLSDDGGTTDGGVDTAATQTFAITVTAVNDVPSFSKGADQTVLEDSGAHMVTGWASAISKGPTNEAAQSLTFTVTNDNNGLFAAAPAVTADGTLTYTLAADAYGTATVTVVLSDDGGTANGGVDTAATQTFTITVSPVNDVPTFTAGANQTVLEDAGAQTVTGWATSISKGPANEAAQNLTFTVTSDNTGLFAVQPAVSADGTLTYTLTANANGAATVSVVLSDDGGGTDTAATQTFTITVTAVNDVPSFTAGADQTVLEDAGAQTVTGWASAISKGPADEAGQSLTFAVTSDNNSLFTTQPAITADGTLTYTLAADANGSATVSVVLSDNGGTAGGGVDTAATQTFTITVTAVNDVPSFTAGADQTVLEDAGAQTVAGWASAISKGPANEAAQSLTFTVTNDNTALFAVQPAITADGTLTYTLVADANGAATVTVTLADDGGTANRGVDTAATQTFTITATPVNDVPSFIKGADQTVREDAGSQTVTGWATAISKGPADEAAQSLTFTLTNDNNSLFATQPAITADGTLTFTLAADQYGTATVTGVLSDDGGTANGGVDTAATQTFTITVTPVNDAPSFTPGANQTVLEDAAAQVLAWASAMGTGPANEAAQTLGFTLTASNPSLFTVQPAITAGGTLTFTLATDANGTSTVSVSLQDDGGTTDGGIDVAAHSFTITVTAVNDSPVFTAAGSNRSQSIAEGQGLAALAARDVDSTELTYSLSGTLPDGITANPDGSFAGAASYKSAGTYTVTATVRDREGGSSSVPLSIEVSVTDTAPTLGSIGNQVSLEGDSVSLSVSGSDLDGDTLSYTAAGLPAGVSIDITTGAIAGVVATGSAGTYAVTVTVNDQTLGGPGGDKASASFTWAVTADLLSQVTVIKSDGEATESNTDTQLITATLDGDDVRVVIEEENESAAAAQPVRLRAAEIPAGVMEDLRSRDGKVIVESAIGQMSVPARAILSGESQAPDDGSKVTYRFSMEAVTPRQVGRGAISNFTPDVEKVQLVVKSVRGGETSGLRPGSKVLQLSAERMVEKDGARTAAKITQFPEPVTVRIPFDQVDDPESLAVYRLNEETGIWELKGGLVNKEEGYIEIELSSFSQYAVMERVWFDDTPAHWAEPSILRLAVRRVVNGVAPHEYNPQGNVTRAEFAALLVRVLGIADEPAESNTFSDVSSMDWYAGTVAAAAKAGLIQGHESKFRPLDSVSRQEMAVMIARALAYIKATGAQTGDLADFVDAEQIGSWAQAAVKTVYGRGLMIGRAGDQFQPTAMATRAEAATLIDRLLQQIEQ